MQKNQLAKYLGNKQFQLSSGIIEIENMLILQNFKQAYVVDSWYQIGFINNEYVAFPFVVENQLLDDTLFTIKNNITIDKDDNIVIKNDSATLTLGADGNIFIEGGNVVLEGSSIKLGSSASLTPITKEDVEAGLLMSQGGLTPAPVILSLTGIPQVQKVKVE